MERPIDEPFDPRPIDTDVVMPETENPDSVAVSERATAVSLVTGEDTKQVKLRAADGDKGSIAEAKAEVLKEDKTLEMVQAELESQDTSPEELENLVLDENDKKEMLVNASEFFIEQAIAIGKPDFTAPLVRLQTNRGIAAQLFLQELENHSLFGKTKGFVDRFMLRQIPIGAVEDITGRTGRKGFELQQAALSMNPEEYTVFIKEYIEELRQERFLDADNFWAFVQGFEEATNGGYDPMEGINRAFGIADFVPGVFAGVRGLVKLRKIQARLRALNKADSPLTTIAAVNGPDAAAKAGVKAVKASADIDPELTVNLGLKDFDLTRANVRPSVAAFSRMLEENELVKGLARMFRSRALGTFASPDEIKAAVTRSVKAFEARSVRPLIDGSIRQSGLGKVDDFDNHFVEMFVGTNKGKPFTGNAAKTNAEKAAKHLPGSEAVPVDVDDLTKGWLVKHTEALDVSGLSSAQDITSLGYDVLRNNLGRYLASTAGRDEITLATSAQISEAAEVGIAVQARGMVKVLNKANHNEKVTISRVFEELRDGPDSFNRDHYTSLEFKEKYKKFSKDGKGPSQKAEDAYNALVDLSDAAWLMRSDLALKRYVRAGYWAIDAGIGDPRIARRITDVSVLKDTDNVLDAASGGLVTGRYREKLTEVWKLDRPTESKAIGETVEYVSAPPSVRPLEHVDVSPYNAGGTRDLSKANRFVTILVGDRLKAIMTSFSEKNAKLAVKELSLLQEAIKATGKRLRDLGDDEIDAVLLKNNTWNPDINTTKKLIQHAAKNKWDLDTGVISQKGKNDKVEAIHVGNDSSHPMAGQTMTDFARNGWSRSDEVMPDFGGDTAFTSDPISSILGQFGTTAHAFAFNTYSQKALVSWVERAKKSGVVKFEEGIHPDDHANLFRSAKVTGTGEDARMIKERANIIKRRLSMKDSAASWIEEVGAEASEFVFNVTGGRITTNIQDINAQNLLLKAGFQTVFGFFNTSQFYMQGFHATTIMAISPRAGLKGAKNAIVMRSILNAPTKEAQDLAIRNLAKHDGDTPEFVRELVDYINSSSRLEIDGDAAELGTGVGLGIRSWAGEGVLAQSASAVKRVGGAALDVGLIPFKAGERLSRFTGINTAFYEFKKAFPNKSALSDEGRAWITRREQDLTFNMTTGSRPAFLSGLLKVPTQWMSYSMRAAEAVFMGRGFTPAERTRMALILGPFYGTTGMGFAAAADYIGEKLGLHADDPRVIGLKYGIIDGLTAYGSDLTDGAIPDTAVTSRLAPIDLFLDTYRKVAEGTLPEVVLGPSGDIVFGATDAFFSALAELRHGNTVSLTEDLIRFIRTPSGVDNMFKTWGIVQNGMLRSKTGNELETELGIGDAIMQLNGFTPMEYHNLNETRTIQFRNKADLVDFKKEIGKDIDTAFTMIQEGRRDRGIEMISEIERKIVFSGFSKDHQRELRSRLLSGKTSTLDRIIRELNRSDEDYLAQRLKSQLKGN